MKTKIHARKKKKKKKKKKKRTCSGLGRAEKRVVSFSFLFWPGNIEVCENAQKKKEQEALRKKNTTWSGRTPIGCDFTVIVV